MVFKGRVDSDTRAHVFYLLSIRKVGDLCDVSRSKRD